MHIETVVSLFFVLAFAMGIHFFVRVYRFFKR